MWIREGRTSGIINKLILTTISLSARETLAYHIEIRISYRISSCFILKETSTVFNLRCPRITGKKNQERRYGRKISNEFCKKKKKKEKEKRNDVEEDQ